MCVLGEGSGSNIPDVLNDVIDLREGGPQQAVAVDADAGFMEYCGDSVDEPIYEDLSPAHSKNKKMLHTGIYLAYCICISVFLSLLVALLVIFSSLLPLPQSLRTFFSSLPDHPL